MVTREFKVLVDDEHIRNVDGVEIPSAHTVKVFACSTPECQHAHLCAFDITGKPVFEVVISEPTMFKCFEIINGWKNAR